MDLMKANFFIRPTFSVTMFMVNKTCQGNAFLSICRFFFLIRSVCWGRGFCGGLFGFIRVISEVCSVTIIFCTFLCYKLGGIQFRGELYCIKRTRLFQFKNFLCYTNLLRLVKCKIILNKKTNDTKAFIVLIYICFTYDILYL